MNRECTAEFRIRTAAAARRYKCGEISWKLFIEEFGDSEDRMISELVDLIEHEPKRGGLLGVSEQQWRAYESRMEAAIRALESYKTAF